jgi:peroxiredoxin
MLTDPVDQSVRHREQSANGNERVWKLVAALAALVLVGFIVYVATRPPHPRPAAYSVTPPATLATGSKAPTFVLPRLGGGPPVSLASTLGTPTVVNFFASWCRDCQAELSAFGALSTQAGGRVAVVGVDSNDTDAAAESVLAKAKVTYPVGVDSNAKVATSYLLTALPVTFFLDADGRVVHVAFGTQTLASLVHWTAVLTAGTAHS